MKYGFLNEFISEGFIFNKILLSNSKENYIIYNK